MKSRNGCWTCKARRVQCDGGLPACQKCARACRTCQGYGARLSWPRDGDKKRAIMGTSPPAVVSPGDKAKLPFINTTWWDLELYHHVNLRMQPRHLVQTSPNLWRQPELGANAMDLVNHFIDSAHLSLVTFDMNTLPIRDALLRMALGSDTATGLALFYALLAFSSLDRNGVNQHAVQLKISALHSLSASSKGGELSFTEAAQHVAASMILGSFDIFLPSASSGEWLWYTQGAMDIVQATCLKDQSHERDTSHLLDWVYFHDAISRFPVQHWQHKSLAREKVHDRNHDHPGGVQYPPLMRHRPALPAPNPTYAILNLLSEACGTLLHSWDPRARNEEYSDRLKDLERRVGTVSYELEWASSDAEAKLAVEVWQTATQVYLVRATQSPWEKSTNLDSLIEMAFAGPIQDCACPHFFPLFILACEAQGDVRRTAILNLIDRADASVHLRSKARLRDLIQSIWVQQDLHADNDLLVNYVSIMGEVISSSNTVPSFA